MKNATHEIHSIVEISIFRGLKAVIHLKAALSPNKVIDIDILFIFCPNVLRSFIVDDSGDFFHIQALSLYMYVHIYNERNLDQIILKIIKLY